jgi:hypothetical protein
MPFNNKNHIKKIRQITVDLENFTKEKYNSCFKTEISELNLCTAGEHRIQTGNERTICQRNGRVPINFEKEISLEIQKLLRLGIIRTSKSPWCSRIVPIRKKDGTLRLCIDFRALNK